MFAKLKRKFWLNRIFEVFIVLFFVLSVLALFIDDVMEFLVTTTIEQVDFNSLSPEQIQEDVYVKGEIRAVTGFYFGHENKATKNPVDMEFIIPVGDKYIGIYCEDLTMRQLDDNMTMYLDACASGEDNPEESTIPVEIQGIIKPMKGESLEAYKEYAALSKSPEKYLPYVLEETEESYTRRIEMFVIAGICAVVLLGGVIYITVRVARGNLRTVTQYCRKRGNKEAVYRELEEFFYAGRAICDILRVDDTFFMMVIKGDMFFAETKDILWIYSTDDANKFKILTVADKNVIKVKMRDGSAMTIGIEDVNTLRSLMRHIASRIPYVFIGYDKETEKLYKHNRYELIRMVDRRRLDYLDARRMDTDRQEGVRDTGYQVNMAVYGEMYREEKK